MKSLMTAVKLKYPRVDPLSGTVPGTKIVLKELVDVYHLTEPDLDESLWRTYGEGYAMLLDTGILGIHTFGIWVPFRQSWVAKVAVQSTQIYPAPNDIKGFIWVLGSYERQLFFAFRFHTEITAKRFVSRFQSCEKGTLLRHSFSDMSDQECDKDGVIATKYINPHQSSLSVASIPVIPPTSTASPVSNVKNLNSLRSIQSRATSFMKKDKVAPMKPRVSGWDADNEEDTSKPETAVATVAPPTARTIARVRSSDSNVGKIQEIGNDNLVKNLENRNGPKVLVLVTDRAKTEAKTFLANGRVGSHNEALRIVNQLKSDGCIHGDVSIKNFPLRNRFTGLLSKFIDFIMQMTNATPRLEVLQLEVDSFIEIGKVNENQTVLSKSKRNILYLDPRSGRATKDYPCCLDLDCMYSQLEPSKRATIDPEELIQSLAEPISAEASASDSTENVSATSSTSAEATSGAVSRRSSSGAASTASETSSGSTTTTKTDETVKVSASTPQAETETELIESTDFNEPKKKSTEGESTVEATDDEDADMTDSTTTSDSAGSIIIRSPTESIAMNGLWAFNTGGVVRKDGADWDQCRKWYEADEFETGPKSEAYKDMSGIVKYEKEAEDKLSVLQTAKKFFSTKLGIRARRNRKETKEATEMFRKALFPNLSETSIARTRYRLTLMEYAAISNVTFDQTCFPGKIPNFGKNKAILLNNDSSDSGTPTHYYDDEGPGAPKNQMGTSNLLKHLKCESSTSAFSAMSRDTSSAEETTASRVVASVHSSLHPTPQHSSRASRNVSIRGTPLPSPVPSETLEKIF